METRENRMLCQMNRVLKERESEKKKSVREKIYSHDEESVKGEYNGQGHTKIYEKVPLSLIRGDSLISIPNWDIHLNLPKLNMSQI